MSATTVIEILREVIQPLPGMTPQALTRELA
jgi:hypothetical protein